MPEMLTVRMQVPDDTNIIIGQSHFIKTVEDLYEAVVRRRPMPSWVGVQRELRSLLDALGRKRPDASGRGRADAKLWLVVIRSFCYFRMPTPSMC